MRRQERVAAKSIEMVEIAMTTHMSRWGQHGPRPNPLAENSALFGAFTLTEVVHVSCPPAEAWALVSDIRRIGEFSPECVGTRWLDGADRLGVGVRFEGTNRVRAGVDEVVWIRPCTVTRLIPGERFAYVVGDRFDGTAAAEWDVSVEPGGDGCVIRQTFRHLPDGLSGVRAEADSDPASAPAILQRRAAALAAGMRETLHRMRAVLEG